MDEKATRNYHKESNYKAQSKYQSGRYCMIAAKIPVTKRAQLDALAQRQGVSVNYLIKDAIKTVYGIDCFTQK